MERLVDLDPENHRAWMQYRRLCNRFANDLQAGSVMLQRFTEDLDAEAFADHMDRLLVIYDVLQPPKAAT